MTTSISRNIIRWNPDITRATGTATNAFTRIPYIEVLSHTFYYFMGEEYRSFDRGLRCMEVRYIEFPL